MSETDLAERIREHRARLAIIGQGYVGLPLAVAFGRAGFPVTGLDTDPDRITALNAGRSYIPDVATTDLQHLLGTGRYEASGPKAATAARSSSPWRTSRCTGAVTICQALSSAVSALSAATFSLWPPR